MSLYRLGAASLPLDRSTEQGRSVRRCADLSTTGAITGAGGQVAGHGEGFRREEAQSYLAAPTGEQPPLGAVDASGVVGEDRLQGVASALVGGAQSSGRITRLIGGRSVDCLRRWSWGSLRRRDFEGAISAGKKLRDNSALSRGERTCAS